MSDQPVSQFGERSPEAVAYKLMRDVLLTLEGKIITEITREEYLDTYVECLEAVLGNRFDTASPPVEDDPNMANAMHEARKVIMKKHMIRGG